MLIDAFGSVALSGAGEDFAATALQAALALGRASQGAVYVLRGQALEALASNLDLEAQRRAAALLAGSDLRTRAESLGPAGGSILVPFGRDGAVIGALYLEGVEPLDSSLGERTKRLAQVLASYFAHQA